MKKRILYTGLVFVFALLTKTASGFDDFSSRNVALVYAGPGVCKENCVAAAAAGAKRAGLQVKLVHPEDIEPELFENATVWVQPGGEALHVVRALSKFKKFLIRKFVADGGGYIGFCAGAFLATRNVDEHNPVLGLDLFPGKAIDLKTPSKYMILPLDWNHETRYIYFEEGAYFDFSSVDLELQRRISIIAKYPNGMPATIFSRFKKGFVAVTGAHPEAPNAWKRASNLEDPDGPDIDLAVGMFKDVLSAQKH